MFARLTRHFRPALLASLAMGPLASDALASGILYNVTNLSVGDPIALNDAGQVAVNRTSTFTYYDPIYDGTSGSARHTSQSTFTHAQLYNSYGPDAGVMTYVGPVLPAASSDPNQLNSVTTHAGKVIAKPETTDTATGLTASGQVIVTTAAGTFLTDGKTYQAAPTSPASGLKMPDGTPIGTASPAAINASGQVAGIFEEKANHYSPHAMLVTNGKVTDLGTLGGSQSTANAINASGQVVGSAQIAAPDGTNPFQSPMHAFLTIGGSMKDLGTLGGSNSAAYGINAQGLVVGASDPKGADTSPPYSYSRDGNPYSGQRAFLFDGSKMIDLNSLISDHLNITLNRAIAINDSGQILAYGQPGTNYADNAYLLTPVGMPTPGPPTPAPEPGTLAIVGLAFGAFWLRRRSLGRKIPDSHDNTRFG